MSQANPSKDSPFQYQSGNFYVSDDIVTLIHHYYNIELNTVDGSAPVSELNSRYQVYSALPVAKISTTQINEAKTILPVSYTHLTLPTIYSV